VTASDRPGPSCGAGRESAASSTSENPLFTIGYEGATPDRLIEALRQAGVTTLVDVRELPNSRRPGFAKRALSEALAHAGIGYRHVRALGTPPEGRAASKAGRTGEMKRIFGARLAGTEAQAAVAALAAEAREGRVCLLCLEADPRRCHRSLVAEAVACPGDIAIVHLHAAGDLPA
jgi:uncharacterized protein (DUF488 family)